MFSITRFARVTAVLAVAAGTSALAVPAHAAPDLVDCTGGSFSLYIDEAHGGTVIGSGTLTGCSSLGAPGIAYANIAFSGAATVNTAFAIVINTTDTITWNTGATTTVTEVRTFTGTALTGFAEVGSGVDVAGLFNPSDENEAATATVDTNIPGVGKGFDADFILFDEVDI